MSLRNENEAVKALKPFRSLSCAAHGCPMPGSITGTTKPSDDSEWLCRFHFNEPVDEWQTITRKVRMLSMEERKTLAFLPMKQKREAA